MECSHDEHPEWIRQRPNEDYYCTVCRMVFYEKPMIEDMNEEQRRVDRLLRK